MNLQALALIFAMPMLGFSLILAFVRLVRGPRLSDRVIALDTMGIVGIGISGAYAIATDQSVMLDVATIMALVLFLGTVAFAYYIERRVGP